MPALGRGSTRGRRLLGRTLGRAALVLLSLGMLVGMEGGLRAVGYGSDDLGALDFGLPSNDRLYEPDPQAPDRMVVTPYIFGQLHSHARYINEDTFLARRPPGQLRIAFCGESFVYGFPVGGPMAFPYQLGDLVRQDYPGWDVQVINSGIPGYDARRVLKVVREILSYEPSIVVLAVGNNEYFRRYALDGVERLGAAVRLRQTLYRLRGYQLLLAFWRPVTGRRGSATVDITDRVRELDKRERWTTPRTLEETGLVMDRYRNNLQRAIDDVKRAGVPLVLCTLPYNLRTFPKRSTYDATVPAEARGRAGALVPGIATAEARGDFTGMEALARQALAIVPGHAHFHFHLGKALEGQGKLGAAREAYMAAKELESTPRRASLEQNEIIRRKGAAAGATMVDLETLLLADMEHGPWGSALFMDHCHPTEEGNGIIARAIFDRVSWERLPR